MSLALDRRTLARDFESGNATVSTSVIPPRSWAYAAQYDFVAQNVIEARSLLDEAGWIVSPSTGVRTRGGIEFRFTLRVDNDPARVAIAGEIARQLDALGMRVVVASTTFLVLQRDFLRERKYDAVVAGWDQGPDPDPYLGWHSSQEGSAGLNFSNFGDLVMDELMAKARTTHDTVVRTDLYRQFQEKWAQLVPGIVLMYPRYQYVYRENLRGVQLSLLATPAQRFYDVHTWTR
jgi:ABC-type transport system substrate-binding protein